jgi:predicted Zn-dependent peptidase
VAFLGELLLCPLLEDGIFCRDYVESEKVNLISAIESRLNNKQAYANDRMLESLCRQDSYGVPRLGTPEAVEAITRLIVLERKLHEEENEPCT